MASRVLRCQMCSVATLNAFRQSTVRMSALFLVITQREAVISCRRFGTTCRFHLTMWLTGCPTTRCVTTQKSGGRHESRNKGFCCVCNRNFYGCVGKLCVVLVFIVKLCVVLLYLCLLWNYSSPCLLGFTYIYINFILSSEYHYRTVHNARGLSVWPKYVACVDGTNKILFFAPYTTLI
jgi:hypothetical protein